MICGSKLWKYGLGWFCNTVYFGWHHSEMCGLLTLTHLALQAGLKRKEDLSLLLKCFSNVYCFFPVFQINFKHSTWWEGELWQSASDRCEQRSVPNSDSPLCLCFVNTYYECVNKAGGWYVSTFLHICKALLETFQTVRIHNDVFIRYLTPSLTQCFLFSECFQWLHMTMYNWPGPQRSIHQDLLLFVSSV